MYAMRACATRGGARTVRGAAERHIGRHAATCWPSVCRRSAQVRVKLVSNSSVFSALDRGAQQPTAQSNGIPRHARLCLSPRRSASPVRPLRPISSFVSPLRRCSDSGSSRSEGEQIGVRHRGSGLYTGCKGMRRSLGERGWCTSQRRTSLIGRDCRCTRTQRGLVRESGTVSASGGRRGVADLPTRMTPIATRKLRRDWRACIFASASWAGEGP